MVSLGIWLAGSSPPSTRMRVPSGTPTSSGAIHSRNTWNLLSKIALLSFTLQTMEIFTPNDTPCMSTNSVGLVVMEESRVLRRRDELSSNGDTKGPPVPRKVSISSATAAGSSADCDFGMRFCSFLPRFGSRLPLSTLRMRMKMRRSMRRQAMLCAIAVAKSRYMAESCPRNPNLFTKDQKALAKPTPKTSPRLLSATRLYEVSRAIRGSLLLTASSPTMQTRSVTTRTLPRSPYSSTFIV
mmetsp:Transcript_22722/g.53118  ORF Transcript_22722/g.53118 Transcript_22722/m.53118 type:complete len:241 (+) Transcript_22722:2009-2731(+)